jgi:polyol transport system substrate-binding protein
MHEASARSVRSRSMLVGAMGAVAVVIAATLAATASGRSTGPTISVAIVANPQMQDIAALTPKLFTAKTGINVKYTILDEGKLREVTTRDVGSGGKAFDAVMIGMYEAPQFGAAGLLQDLTPNAKSDSAYA